MSASAVRRGESRKTLALRKVILEELDAYAGPMSSRQLFYRCVSRGAVANDKRSCNAVLRRILLMRRDGSIPYDRIVDRTRRKYHQQGWDSLREAIEMTGAAYRRDLWDDQDIVAMVGCEKAALEGVFSRIVDEYGASLWTLRGYASESFAWEWAEDIRKLNKAGQNVAITYFGDFDPSGMSIEASTRDKLAGFGADFTWQRGGLLPEDMDGFELVPVPIKPTDTRAKAFLSTFGGDGAELDALPPKELERRIRLAIEQHVDGDRWQAGRLTEQRERESLDLVARNWDAALAAVQGAA
jgi:hypothetical protein